MALPWGSTAARRQQSLLQPKWSAEGREPLGLASGHGWRLGTDAPREFVEGFVHARHARWPGAQTRGGRLCSSLGSALVSPPPGSLPGCPAGICNDSEAPGAWPASSWRSCRREGARGHLCVGATHGQQPGAQNRDGEASVRSQNQARSGGAHSAEKMLRLKERAWRGLSPRVLGRALR